MLVNDPTWLASIGIEHAGNHESYWPNMYCIPGIPTTIKTMGVNITTIVYLRVLIIQIGSTIILKVVEA